MLKVLIFLLDLVLMFSVSILISGNTSTLISFGLGILLTIRVTLNIIVRRIKIPPSTAINALLQHTTAPQGDRCLVCHADNMFEPRKLSCDRVFCRDCALLVLCKQDTCPMCQRVPFQQIPIVTVVPFETFVALVDDHAVRWLCLFLIYDPAWFVPCVWQSRYPTGSELVLAAIRATIHLALHTDIVEITSLSSAAAHAYTADRGSWTLSPFYALLRSLYPTTMLLGYTFRFSLQWPRGSTGTMDFKASMPTS
jgi:hypothetical protein